MLRDKIVRRLAGWITGHRWIVMSFTTTLGVVLLLQLPRVQSKTDVDVFYIPTNEDFILHKTIEKLYRRNEFFSILYKDKNLFSPDRLADLAAMTEALEALPDIDEIISLANINDMRGTNDSFIVEPFLHDTPTTPDGLDRLRQRAMDKPLYKRRLISEDGTTTAIGVFLPHSADGDLRRRVLAGVETALAPYRARGYQFHLVGWPVMNVRLVEFMNQDMSRFLPYTLILALGMIWFVFRNGRLLFLSGLGVVLTVSATLGFAGWVGLPINNASIAAFPIVMALALSDLVHLFSHLDRKVLSQFPDRTAALTHVLEQILFPCLLTSVNTAIGFLSFSSNQIPAVREFGWLAASGMMFEFLFTFGLVAPLLLFFKPERVYRKSVDHARHEIPRLVQWVHGLVLRRPVGTLIVCLFALTWGGWQSRHVQVETDLVKFFPSHTPVRQDMEFTNKNLGGIQTLNVEFSSEREAFKDPDRLAALARLETALETVPGVDQVISVVDYFREMNKAFHAEDPAYDRLPDSRRLLEQYLLLYNADDLDEVVTPGFDRTRLCLLLKETSSQKNAVTLKRVKELIADNPVPGAHPVVVGNAVNLVNSTGVMVGDQLRNIGQAVGSIWLVMVVVLRSVGLATLFLVPNLFPIVLNFGIMGTFDIPIDTGTALIAASAFGIIVDDTVHFFTRFAQRRQQGWSYDHALNEVTGEKGEAALSSFLILSMGFGVLTLGHFVPVIRFGMLNILVLTTGMFGDMFFLKSIMGIGRRWIH
ncbi:MAG: MMPL family transporter [Elusimicrobia bacterium]|nr:MMPL family transporter [Elusimicrobiota bacterium]